MASAAGDGHRSESNPYRSPPQAGAFKERPDQFALGVDTASRRSRLAAAVIDAVVPAIVYFIAYQVCTPMRPVRHEFEFGIRIFNILPVPNTLFWSFAILCVYEAVQSVMTALNGQTLGKKILKIRIVRLPDDSNPGFVHGVLVRRWLIGILALIPGFALIDALSIFREQKRCFHDQIAGTRVLFTDLYGDLDGPFLQT